MDGRGCELTAELGNAVTVRFKSPEGADGVLMGRLELRVVFGLALQIHLLEHVQSRLLAMLTKTGATLGLNGTSELPAFLVTLEAESLAVVTSSDNLILATPDKTLEGKQLRGQGDDSSRGLVRTGRVNHSDAAIMGRKRKAVSTGGERN